MSNLPPAIELERVDPAHNMARFYVLEIELDLFGQLVARRRWGRIGSRGRALAEVLPNDDAARVKLAELERVKRLRGYVDRCWRS